MTLIREASAADGPALVSFFRDTPLRAGTEFVLDRGPDFEALLRLRGQHRTFLALRAGCVVGAVTALWHEAMDDDRALVIGEVVDLRVAPQVRGSPVAARLLTRAAAAFEEARVECVLCLVGDRNLEARRLVSGGAGLPGLAPVSRYASVHYVAWRLPKHRSRGGLSIRRATADDGPLLAQLVRDTASGRRFTPVSLFSWPDPEGAHHAWLAEDDSGQTLGGLVLWDPMVVRRIRVRRYSAADHLLRGFMALGSLVGAATPLPRPGEPLRIWASRWLGVRDNVAPVTSGLIRAAIRGAAAAGQHVIQLNLERRDPLLGHLPLLPRSFYWSTLYGCLLRDTAAMVADADICHTDVALV